MKKIFTILAAAATVAALASCAKERFEMNADKPSYPTKTVVFATDFSKTAIVEGTALGWTEGDAVRIIWKQDLENESGVMKIDSVCSVVANVDCQTGEIIAEVGEAKDYYYAVYPATATVSLRPYIEFGTGDTLSVKIPNLCDGTFAQAHYAVATTSADNTELIFKTVNNIIKFSVTSSDAAMVEFRASDSKNVAGTMDIPFNYDAALDPVQTASGAKMQVSVSGPGEYYAPLIGSLEIGGLAVAEYTAENEVVSYSIGQSPMLGTAGTLFKLGNLEDHKFEPHDWYITVDGMGAGTSWDDPADVNMLKTLLGSYVGGWMANNSNIYLAEGEYDLNMGKTGTAGMLELQSNYPVVTNLYGGYSQSSTGTDLTQRNPEENPTVFTNKAEDKYGRVLYWTSFKGDQLYDGITFKVQDNNDYRGCLYANASGQGSLTFNNCTWKDANIVCKGAVGQFASMNVTFSNCTIKDNKSSLTSNSDGGTVHITNLCTAKFENCTFSNNELAAPGNAILVSGGTAFINNCTFIGNKCTATTLSSSANSARSGCVALYYGGEDYNQAGKNKTAPSIYIDNCIFKNNSSSTTAADIYAYNTTAGHPCNIFINRSYFAGAEVQQASNMSDTYYAKSIWAEQKAVIDGPVNVYLYNCTLGPTTSPKYASMPNIGVNYGCNLSMVNCTAVDKGVAVIRNNAKKTEGRYSCFNLMNCIVSHTASSSNVINLANNTAEMNCGYNIMGNCKNKYAWTDGKKPVTETDGYVLYNDLNWDVTTYAADKYFTFEIAAGKDADADRPVQYTTRDDVATFVATHLPDFDAWLKTIHEDPYAIDIRGELRNPSKLQKGSWDPGL